MDVLTPIKKRIYDKISPFSQEKNRDKWVHACCRADTINPERELALEICLTTHLFRNFDVDFEKDKDEDEELLNTNTEMGKMLRE